MAKTLSHSKVRFFASALAVAILAWTASIAEAQARSKFDLPSQPLADSLRAVGSQTNVNVLFDPPLVAKYQAPPLKGEFTADQAFTLLLHGTGIKHDYMNDRTIVLASAQGPAQQDGKGSGSDNASPGTGEERAPQSWRSEASGEGEASNFWGRFRLAQAETSVQSSSSSSSSSGIIDEVTVFGRGVASSTRSIPQTVSVLDNEMLNSTASIKLTDVLRFIPTASNLVSEFAPGSNINIRGFRSSQTWNGMSIRSILKTPDLANVERVEVLMGPASVLYGSMEPGAVINIVTKQPRDEFHMEFGAEYGSHDKKHLTVDVGGPLSESVRARLNVSHQDTDAPFDFWNFETLLVAPVVEIDLSPVTLLTLEGVYDWYEFPRGYYDGRRPAVGTVLPNPLGEIPLSVNLGYEPHVSWTKADAKDFSARLSHQFTDTESINVALAHARTLYRDVTVFPNMLQPDNRTVSRFVFYNEGNEGEDSSAHLDFRGSFNTGAVAHQYTVGFDYRTFEAESHSTTIFAGITPIDVFTPVYGTLVLPNPVPVPKNERSLETIEGFLQDRIAIGDKLDVLLGARYTDFYQDSKTTPFGGSVPGPATIIDTNEWATQAGIVYDATDALTLFASRNTSFVPRAGTSVGTGVVEPEEGTQYELGAKFDIGASGLTGNATVYYIEKPNVLTPSGTDPTVFVPLGAVESRGVELGVQGRPLPDWSLYAAVGFSRSEISEGNDPTIKGKSFANAPEESFSLVSSYEIQSGMLRGLALSGSVVYLGERFADPRNTLVYPSYTTVDLGMTYSITDHLELAFFGKNLTDEDIYSGFQNTVAIPSLGRNYLGQVKYKL